MGEAEQERSHLLIGSVTYDSEQIHVSTRTVWANPRRFKICSKQASRQDLQLLCTLSGMDVVSPQLARTQVKYGR